MTAPITPLYAKLRALAERSMDRTVPKKERRAAAREASALLQGVSAGPDTLSRGQAFEILTMMRDEWPEMTALVEYLTHCRCGWPRPLIHVMRADGGPVAEVLVHYDCPSCGVVYNAGELEPDPVLSTGRGTRLARRGPP
jgi:hypothetical protein